MLAARRIALHLALTAAPVAAAPSFAAAQLRADMDVEARFASAYVDRGVILTNLPVLQPSLKAAIAAGGGRVGLGVAATLQPTGSSDPRWFGMAGTAKSPNVTEVRPSLVLAQPFGPVTFDLTASWRMFPNGAGITKAGNMGAVETRLVFHRGTTEAALGAGYELGAVTGAAVDAHLSQALPLGRGAALVFGGRVGWGIRQRADSAAPAPIALLAHDGLGFIDLTAAADVSVAKVRVRPFVTLTHVPDSHLHHAEPGHPGLQRRWTAQVGASVALHAVLPPGKKASAPLAAPAGP
jgi:hypothetical protein